MDIPIEAREAINETFISECNHKADRLDIFAKAMNRYVARISEEKDAEISRLVKEGVLLEKQVADLRELLSDKNDLNSSG